MSSFGSRMAEVGVEFHDRALGSAEMVGKWPVRIEEVAQARPCELRTRGKGKPVKIVTLGIARERSNVRRP